MRRIPMTRWFRIRVVLAIGVLGLLIYELAAGRNWIVVLIQAVLILGIIGTSVLDLRDLHRQRGN